jgi:DNA repair protein RadC
MSALAWRGSPPTLAPMASWVATVRERQRISDTAVAAALFAPTFVDPDHESLSIAHLDADLRLIYLATLPGGGADSIELPLRTVMGDALALNAHALIVAHNHPGGDPNPSRADKVATRRLVETARPLDIRVIDHLIFCGEGVTSFRALGLL